MPFLDAPPTPAKNDKGMLITSAHGHDTTKNESARYIQVDGSFVIIDGTTAKRSAKATTAGVYTLENLVMKFSARDLFSEAFSTRFKILETVES